MRPYLALFFILMLLLLPATPSAAWDKDKKSESQGATVIDSGSFGIFVRGQRVATEEFQIEQRPNLSTASATLTMSQGAAEQTAQMDLSSNGDLKRYRWKELKPGQAENLVEADQVFLVEHVVANPKEQPQEITHVLPPSTVVLDDYFFSHRQILIWRYLASGDCKVTQDRLECQLTPRRFGIFVPRQHSSGIVEVRYAGRDKVTLKGKEQDLYRFEIEGDETPQWSLWTDEQHKLVRVVIASQQVEVLRD